MSNFDIALQKLLAQEGGYVFDKDDSGGATNFGISLKFLQTIVPDATINDIKSLSLSGASSIYKSFFWDKNNIGLINSQKLANMMLSECVNMGSKTFIEIFQNSINNINKMQINNMEGTNVMSPLSIDGIIGSETITKVNLLNENDLITELKDKCRLYYSLIAAKNPSQKKFLSGWYNRINSF
jgi:lysozyme family protein